MSSCLQTVSDRKFVLWIFLRFIFVTTLFLAVHSSMAQVIPRPLLILKTIPSTLIDFENTFTLGVEVPLSNRWSVQQEVGWGHNSFNVYAYERERYPDRQTWRFRSQVRYYFSDISSPNGSFFLALEYFRKNVFTDEVRAVGQNCNPLTGACSYFQIRPVRTQRQVSAGHFKWGYAFETPHKLALEIYMGVGVRQLIVTDNSGTSDGNPRMARRFSFRPNEPGVYKATPGFSAGIALGYAFRSRKSKKLYLP